MRDPYIVLGVARSASEAEIKSAYRRLAKRLHPDLHPGQATAELRFQELQTAYNILKSPALRHRYDRGVLDTRGNPKPSPFEEALKRNEAERAAAKAARAAAKDEPPPAETPPEPIETAGPKPRKAERDSILSELLANLRRARKPAAQELGTLQLTVSFAEAARGARREISLPSGRQIGITIPPGTEDGQILRLRNRRLAATGTDTRHDPGEELAVEITVSPDPRFVRDGLDLIGVLPVSLPEAVLGARIQTPVPGGAVKVTIPPGANGGTVLKLRGQGIRLPGGEAGDLRLELRLMLPAKIDPALEALIRAWADNHPYSARP